MSQKQDTDKIRAFLVKAKSSLRIQKVVCTRMVKGPRGDTFVGFSASWDTIEEGGDDNPSLIDVGEDTSNQGMTLREARAASHLLAMQADIAAYEHAMAGGTLATDVGKAAVQTAKINYSLLIQEELSK